MVLLVRVRVPAEFATPPPIAAELPVMVLLVTVRVPQVHHAAAVIAVIPGDGAVGYGEGAGVVRHAAAAVGGIAGDGAVGDGEGAAEFATPPPQQAELPVMVLLVTVRVPP